jgi:hypothetical protein
MLISELTERFLAYCSRHRAPATLGFYRTRLKKFCQQYNGRDLASLTPLEIDEHYAERRLPTSTGRRMQSSCGSTRPLEKPGSPDASPSAGNWGNFSGRPSGNDKPARFSFPLPGRRGLSRISAERTPGSGTLAVCRGIWSCTSPGTSAARRFVGRRGSSMPGGCSGIRTFRPHSDTCTSTTRSWPRRRI